MIFDKSFYSFDSIIYYLEKYGLNNLSLDIPCLYKYDYFQSKNWMNKYMPEFKQMINIIIKSKYYSTLISELFNKNKKKLISFKVMSLLNIYKL